MNADGKRMTPWNLSFKRRSLKAAFLILALLSAGFVANAQTSPSQADPYAPLPPRSKAAIFGRRIVAPSGFAKSAVTAGINQWQDSPHEWGQGLGGYGKRYGHKIANRSVENAIGMAVAITTREDPRYFRSRDSAFGHRLRHALVSALLTRTDGGGSRVALWRLSGNYGAQFVSNAWRPDRYTDTRDTLRRGTVSIGYDGISNLLKEFWPDIRRRVFHR